VRVRNNDTTLYGTEFSAKVTRNFNKSSLTFWDDTEIDRIVTYNSIIEDLIDLEYTAYYLDLQIRVNGDESINEIFMDIITRNSETMSTLGYHKSTIQHYLDQDIMNLFK
jgi:hypothetical protein